MARRSPQTAVKRAREQALREKRERKQAKKDARAAERLNPTEEITDADGNVIDGESTEGETPEATDDETPDAADDGEQAQPVS